jgi:NAD(P)-dependent dehydrogenase (short-subunit alcohol dehydrogenase family)
MVSASEIYSQSNKYFFRGIGLAVTRILLRKFNANVVALSRSRTPELTKLSSKSLLIVECDVSVHLVILIFKSVNSYRRS